MAYVAPTVRSVGDAVTAADYNIMANDVLDHESRILLAPQRIETVTLTSTGNISFSSIPQTYGSLRIVFRGRAAAATTAVGVGVRFNGDSASNYSFTFTQTNNATVSGGNVTTTSISFGVIAAANADASNYGAGVIDIPQYSVTSTGYKTGVGSGGTGASATVANAYQRSVTGQWHNTAAITSIQVIADNATTTFLAGSFATLIGMP